MYTEKRRNNNGKATENTPFKTTDRIIPVTLTKAQARGGCAF